MAEDIACSAQLQRALAQINFVPKPFCAQASSAWLEMARADRDTAGMLALRDVYERRRGGLLAVAADANVRFAPLPGATTRPLVAPRLNAVVMLTGNHSAGKSSFVNYLSRRNVQPTGDAVETTGFTVVRGSRGRAGSDAVCEHEGEAVFVDDEELAAAAARLPAEERKAFISSLLLKCVPSSKDLRALTVIDTPGLVDGGVDYAFNIGNAIVELSTTADLIIVMLDPVGQALCARTLDVVSSLFKRGLGPRTRFYLTKADTIASQKDAIKVAQQLAAALAGRIGLVHGLTVPAIFLPAASRGVAEVAVAAGAAGAMVPNALPDLEREIERVVSLRFGRSLAAAEADCAALDRHIVSQLALEESLQASAATWRSRATLCGAALALASAALAVDATYSLGLDPGELLEATGRAAGMYAAEAKQPSWSSAAAALLRQAALAAAGFARLSAPAHARAVRVWGKALSLGADGSAGPAALTLALAALCLLLLLMHSACAARARAVGARSRAQMRALEASRETVAHGAREITSMLKAHVRED